jgi:hypothetical protein
LLVTDGTGFPFSVFRFPFSVFRFPFSVFRFPFSVFRFPLSPAPRVIQVAGTTPPECHSEEAGTSPEESTTRRPKNPDISPLTSATCTSSAHPLHGNIRSVIRNP